jgi:hypothetical protein
MSIGMTSRKYPNTFTRMLTSREGMNTAMSSQDDDALTLVDILDQASKPQEAKKAREIVDMLDLVRQSGNKYLRSSDGASRLSTTQIFTNASANNV